MDYETVAVLFVSAVIGLIPATIAYCIKNRNFMLWWFFGFLFPIIAIIVILCVSSLKSCSSCAEKVKKAASICKHCKTSLPV